jgi:perosamine synthetase
VTTGEGGVITTDDPQWHRQLRSLRNQGRGEDAWLAHHQLGFNYRLDEMSAALGVSQMSRIDSLLARRALVRIHRAACVYRRRRGHETGGRDQPDELVRLYRAAESGISRDNVAARLGAQGIPTRNYFPPIHLQPFFIERYGYKHGQFPVTERISACTLALPFHPNMHREAVERVYRALKTAIDEESRGSDVGLAGRFTQIRPRGH